MEARNRRYAAQQSLSKARRAEQLCTLLMEQGAEEADLKEINRHLRTLRDEASAASAAFDQYVALLDETARLKTG